MVPVGHVGVDDRGQGQAAHDDAQARDALGHTQAGAHGDVEDDDVAADSHWSSATLSCDERLLSPETLYQKSFTIICMIQSIYRINYMNFSGIHKLNDAHICCFL